MGSCDTEALNSNVNTRSVRHVRLIGSSADNSGTVLRNNRASTIIEAHIGHGTIAVHVLTNESNICTSEDGTESWLDRSELGSLSGLVLNISQSSRGCNVCAANVELGSASVGLCIIVDSFDTVQSELRNPA